MKIYKKTRYVLLLLAFSVTTAFSQPEGQEGKPPPKDKTPIVRVEKEKNDREQEERKKQEEQKRREQERNKKPQ